MGAHDVQDAGVTQQLAILRNDGVVAAAQAEGGAEKAIAELQAWQALTRETFIRAYAEAMKGSGLFDSFDDVRGLLDLAELEKALYELRYEANNRPDWLHIPLSGLKAKLT